MKASIIPSSRIPSTRNIGLGDDDRWLDRLAKKTVLARLNNLEHGAIEIHDGQEKSAFGQPTEQAPWTVRIDVLHPQFYSDIAFGGSIGAGESYIQEHWQCSDLTRLVQILLLNRSVLDGMDSHFLRWQAPLYSAFHWLNRNTRTGSRRNIEAHYDLGNDLFALFLDETMMYSAGVYPFAGASLYEASVEKIDRICKKLQLSPSDHVLEIGTGWGGFAIHAARNYGCKVTTTTISKEQYSLASQRVREAGLEDQVTLLLEDYRDLVGQYDKLVSIEMIEAIGHQYQDTYFEKCSRLLKADGMMLLQAITISDQRYAQALRSVDFIQRYIFPGSYIPCVSGMSDAIARKTDMKIFHLEDIGPHYARTLAHWRERFLDNIDAVRTLGYSENFIRMWEFYLCYCEGGFLERALGDVQILLTKPRCKREAIVATIR